MEPKPLDVKLIQSLYLLEDGKIFHKTNRGPAVKAGQEALGKKLTVAPGRQASRNRVLHVLQNNCDIFEKLSQKTGLPITPKKTGAALMRDNEKNLLLINFLKENYSTKRGRLYRKKGGGGTRVGQEIKAKSLVIATGKPFSRGMTQKAIIDAITVGTLPPRMLPRRRDNSQIHIGDVRVETRKDGTYYYRYVFIYGKRWRMTSRIEGALENRVEALITKVLINGENNAEHRVMYKKPLTKDMLEGVYEVKGGILCRKTNGGGVAAGTPLTGRNICMNGSIYRISRVIKVLQGESND